jgi:hypothetical protein
LIANAYCRAHLRHQVRAEQDAAARIVKFQFGTIFGSSPTVLVHRAGAAVRRRSASAKKKYVLF